MNKGISIRRAAAVVMAGVMSAAMMTGCGADTGTGTSANAAASASAGEGKEEASQGASGSAAAGLRYEDTQFLSLYSSTPGGGMYNMAAALAPIWEEQLNVTVSIGPGGSFSDFMAVSKKEADIGMCHQCLHYWAERGEEPFDAKIDGLCTLTTLFPATVQVFTAKDDTAVSSLKDIGDKRIGLGTQGSTLNIFVLDYLNKTYGITLDSITAAGGSVSYMSDSEMSSALSDGIIDIGFALGTYPKSSLQEIENTPGIRLVEFGDDLDEYIAGNAGWATYVIPANTYAGQDKDYKTAASWAVLTVSKDMDEELAYRLTRSMWENIGKAGEASFEIKNFMKLDTATAAMSGAPLHPGAERYYREAGILK